MINPMLERRYAGFTLRTECTECGMPVPLDRPTRQTTCPQCHADIALPEEIWHHVLALFESDARPEPTRVLTQSEAIAGFNVHYQVANTPPCCEKCGTRYPVNDLPAAAAQDFSCTSCGDPASVWPAPDWLRLHVPTLSKLVSTAPGGASMPEGQPLDADVTEQPKPVAMSCPQCGGALSITAQHERILPCLFCGADVFLPDEVWRRLHPVKTVQWWFACYEGKTAEEKRRDREAAELAAERKRKKARADEAFKRQKWAWLAMVPFVLWQALLVVVLFSGTLGSAMLPYLAVSAGLYTVAVVAAAWVIAIADAGTTGKTAFWFWIGGVFLFSIPAAGVLFGLFAIVFVVKTKQPDPDNPALGVGRPMGFTYLAYAVGAQSVFFANALLGGP